MLKNTLLLFILIQLVSCNKSQEVLNLEIRNDHEFYYFSNGHLSKDKYAFKTIKKEGKTAGEIIRASDASVWSGIATELKKTIQTKNNVYYVSGTWARFLDNP